MTAVQGLTIPAIEPKQSCEKLTGKSHATEHFDHLSTALAALTLSACASRNDVPVSSLGEDDDAICRANNVAVGSSDYVACRKNRDVQRGNAAARADRAQENLSETMVNTPYKP